MSAAGRMRAWMHTVLLRQSTEREMHLEMAAHIEQATQRFKSRGMIARDALHEARKEFGQVSVLQEEARDARGGRWVEILISDVRHAFRYFTRAPITTATVVLVLMLGISVNAAVFSVAMSTRRPPPGIKDDPSLVMFRGITSLPGRTVSRAFSFPEVEAYANLTNVFESFATWGSGNVVLDLGDVEAGVTTESAYFVGPKFFRTLGVNLISGSDFVDAPLANRGVAELTAIVTHAFAAAQFGTAENAVGQHIRLNNVLVEILGVTPPAFRGLSRTASRREFWLPLSAWEVVENQSHSVFATLDSAKFQAVGRLRTGKTIAAANSALRVAASHVNLKFEWPDFVVVRGELSSGPARKSIGGLVDLQSQTRPVATTDVVPLRGATQVEQQRFESSMLWTLTVCVLLILLVCTTTVTSLLIASGVNRRNEIGVRLALGASRARIVQQLLTESVLLALIAGGAGVLLFAVAYRVYASQIAVDFAPDWTTVLFTAAFSVFTAVLCGLSPALHATRSGLSALLKDASRASTSRSQLQRTFVVTQITLTQPLLVGLALTMVQLQSFALRGRSLLDDQLIVAEFDPLSGRNGSSRSRMQDVQKRLQTALGVRRVVAIGGFTMLTLHPARLSAAIESGISRPVEMRVAHVPVGYFEAIGAPLLYGREFTLGDDPVSMLTPTIVTAKFAKALFGTANAVGRHLQSASDGALGTEFEIVGVVAGDSIDIGTGAAAARIFIPHSSDQMFSTGRLLIRTASPGAEMIPMLRKLARMTAPTIPIKKMQTHRQIADAERSTLVRATSASAIGGLIVLSLAAIGLYAVVALNVGQRRREIGIRIAMGARPGQVVGMFFARGVKLSIVGLVIGLPFSAAAAGAAMQRPGAPHPSIILIAISIAACVVAVASVASWLPARQAARVDPLTALRAE